ncbi:hypothetical protein MMC11_001665 [Xylographa trunciseda]|nr:hypothetical protein [Xylographa trunciseda]
MSTRGVRTRAQRSAALALGIPPTPPQELPPTTRATRIPRSRKITKKDEVSSCETTQSSLPLQSDAQVPKVPLRQTTQPSLPLPFDARVPKIPYFSDFPLSLVHIWLRPAPETLKSKALNHQEERSIRIAVPYETVQDFLSTLQPAYKPSTIPVVAQTLAPSTFNRTNISRRMKAAKRKLAETDAASESPSKRAKSTAAPAPVIPAIPVEHSDEALCTVMMKKPRVRVPLGHKAFDRKGNLIMLPYRDDEDLIMPEEVRRIPTSQMSLMRMLEESKKLVEQKGAARAALKEQERLNSGATLDIEIDSQSHDGGPSASTATGGINTSHNQGHPESTHGIGMPSSSASESIPSRQGFLGSIMGSVRKFVPGLHRTPLVNVSPAVSQVGTSMAAQASATIVNNTYDTNDTLANNATSNSTTHKPLSSDPEDTEEPSIRESLKVPKPTLITSDARRKAAHKKQRKMDGKQKSKKARERTIEDEVARRVKEQLAALTGSKRKRYSPDRIPNPAGASYGLDTQFFVSDSESDEEDEDISDNSPSIRPAKRQRPNSDMPSTPPQQIIGDPHRATPYTGKMFADPKPNLFKRPRPNVFNPQQPKVSFAVPESSSDEHSDGVDTTTTVSKNKGKGKEVQFSDKVDFSDQHTTTSMFNASLSSEPLKSAMKSTTKSAQSWQQVPPPPPTPSHAALPIATPAATSTASSAAIPTLPTSNPMSDTEALARVRSQALRYTPIVPSSLRATSRLSSSSIGTFSDGNTYDPDGAYDISQYKTLQPDQVEIVNGQLRPVAGCIPARLEPEEMDQEVRVAVDAIAENDLADFGFPARLQNEDDIDPDVRAALDAAWDVEDENRACCVFNETLTNYLDGNKAELLVA